MTHAVGLEVNGVAACFFIPNKKRIAHELQIGNEHLLNIFFQPRLYVSVKDLRPPQLSPGGGIRRYDVLVGTTWLGGVADSTCDNRSDGFWRQPFRYTKGRDAKGRTSNRDPELGFPHCLKSNSRNQALSVNERNGDLTAIINVQPKAEMVDRNCPLFKNFYGCGCITPQDDFVVVVSI